MGFIFKAMKSDFKFKSNMARFIPKEIAKEIDHRTVILDISLQSCTQYVFIHLVTHIFKICIQNMFLYTSYAQVNAIHNEGTIKKKNRTSIRSCPVHPPLSFLASLSLIELIERCQILIRNKDK